MECTPGDIQQCNNASSRKVPSERANLTDDRETEKCESTMSHVGLTDERATVAIEDWEQV
eukprot:4716839-Prymnesium_polylepis.2